MELDEMAEAAVAAAREVIGGPREHWKDDREIDKTLARIGAEVRKRLAPARKIPDDVRRSLERDDLIRLVVASVPAWAVGIVVGLTAWAVLR